MTFVIFLNVALTFVILPSIAVKYDNALRVEQPINLYKSLIIS